MQRRLSTDRPAPNIGPAIRPIDVLHVLGNANILRSVITANTTRNAVESCGGEKKVENGLSAVVVVGTNGDNKPRLAIYETMDDDFEPDQS